MQAMILAAGRGERLRPLTDNIPKPLLKVKGEALIVQQIKKLQAAGVEKIVINVSWLGDMIMDYLGDGANYGVAISYSIEPAGALETAGGIIEVLPELGQKPFIVVNSDIHTSFDYSDLNLAKDSLAHLILVANPEHNLQGDFSLVNGQLTKSAQENYTFSGIGLYRPELFKPYAKGRRSLLSVLSNAMENSIITGELFAGTWHDIGTLKRLEVCDL